MLRTIIKREILEYLKSAKFLVGLLIAIVLTAASTALNVQDYVTRHQDYLDAKKEYKSNNFEIVLFREPQVLSAFARGKDRDMGSQTKMSVMNAPGPLTGYMGDEPGKSPSFAGFSAVDLAFIIRVVLSLLAVFLAYNAVSEEKANGTLKLALSNAVPRDKLLLGKLVSGLAAVVGPLAVVALLSSIILILHPGVSLSADDLVRIGLMFVVSIVYLSVFYALGLFVSVKTERPAVSLMILLQAWVFLVVLYPNLSVTVAERISPLPSEEVLAKQKDAVVERHDADIKKANEGLHKVPPTSEDRLRFNDAWSAEAADFDQIEGEFSRRQTAQAKLAEALSVLSPAAVYDQLMGRLGRTDIREYDRFMDDAHRLWLKHIERARLRYRDEDAYKRTPLPDFSHPPESAGEAAASVWPQVIILVLFGLIFFALAYTGFLRKDLR
ncbi:MAG TPA: ABC transporter permease subunit, partial [Terriglobales bacterium]|nr:ABC transporter permease subunit [Terriglobales bacterium]